MKAKRLSVIVDSVVFDDIVDSDGVIQILLSSGDDAGFKVSVEDVDVDSSEVTEAADIGLEESDEE